MWQRQATDGHRAYDTQSRRDRTQSPSTPGHLKLSTLLGTELLAIGLTDAAFDGHGSVAARIALDAVWADDGVRRTQPC